jgi:hypothetical protein
MQYAACPRDVTWTTHVSFWYFALGTSTTSGAFKHHFDENRALTSDSTQKIPPFLRLPPLNLMTLNLRSAQARRARENYREGAGAIFTPQLSIINMSVLDMNNNNKFPTCIIFSGDPWAHKAPRRGYGVVKF